MPKEPESGKSFRVAGVPVRIHQSATAVTEAILDELRIALAGREHPLVSFATGATFRPLFARLDEEVAAARLDLSKLCATHLDEYLDFAPDRPGGMVHELRTACPPLAACLAEGRLCAVPAAGDPAALAGHERRLARLGGIDLQLLGIGRNGHVAFNEPGTDFALGFHEVALAPTTRADARRRFAPDEPPAAAVTAGPASILAARRVVLAATGAHKAPAVRAMLEGDVDPSCPASMIRRHPNALVLLDGEAAGMLAVARGRSDEGTAPA